MTAPTTAATTEPQTDRRQAALAVDGMTCASCVSHVEKAAGKVAGVDACEVNLARGRAVVKFDPHQTSPQAIAQAITDAGYDAQPQDESVDPVHAEHARLTHQHEHARSWLRRAIVGIALWLPAFASSTVFAAFAAWPQSITWNSPVLPYSATLPPAVRGQASRRT